MSLYLQPFLNLLCLYQNGFNEYLLKLRTKTNNKAKMTLHKKQTERHILDTAKKVFFQDGNLNATTQEIADAAQVNRTLVHYYFRSRDALFKEVFLEGKRELRTSLSNVFRQEIPFRQKLEHLIDTYHTFISNYPYQEIFLINAVNSNDPLFEVTPACPHDENAMQNFLKEIQQQIDLGLIKKMEPEVFLMSIYAIISYPIMMKPLYTKIFSLPQATLQEKMETRKQLIMDLFFA